MVQYSVPKEHNAWVLMSVVLLAVSTRLTHNTVRTSQFTTAAQHSHVENGTPFGATLLSTTIADYRCPSPNAFAWSATTPVTHPFHRFILIYTSSRSVILSFISPISSSADAFTTPTPSSAQSVTIPYLIFTTSIKNTSTNALNTFFSNYVLCLW